MPVTHIGQRHLCRGVRQSCRLPAHQPASAHKSSAAGSAPAHCCVQKPPRQGQRRDEHRPATAESGQRQQPIPVESGCSSAHQSRANWHVRRPLAGPESVVSATTTFAGANLRCPRGIDPDCKFALQGHPPDQRHPTRACPRRTKHAGSRPITRRGGSSMSCPSGRRLDTAEDEEIALNAPSSHQIIPKAAALTIRLWRLRENKMIMAPGPSCWRVTSGRVLIG